MEGRSGRAAAAVDRARYSGAIERLLETIARAESTVIPGFADWRQAGLDMLEPAAAQARDSIQEARLAAIRLCL